tara:strand:- start:51 stop:272 length:222 start_codon:yes stop_codon:yes gene_type:complete
MFGWRLNNRDNRATDMWTALRQFCNSKDGATSVEYAFMLGLIIVACIAGILIVSGNVSNSMNDSATEIQNYTT